MRLRRVSKNTSSASSQVGKFAFTEPFSYQANQSRRSRNTVASTAPACRAPSESSREARNAPAADLGFGLQVNDRYLARLRHVHEHAAGDHIQLEAFGVRSQLCAATDRKGSRIKNGKAPMPVSDKHPSRPQVDPDIVGIFAEADRADRGKVTASEQTDGAVASVCDRDRV